MKNHLLVFLLVLTVFSVNASADKYAGEFLYVGAGARALGMGSAFASVANDITAAYWNPAGLVSTRERTAAFMHSERFGGLISYDYLAYSQEYAGDVFSASIFRTDAGDIANTNDLQWYDTGSDGVFGEDGSGEPGDSGNDDWDSETNPSGTEGNGKWDPGEELIYDEGRITWESASDNALYLSWGRAVNENLSIGASSKIIYRKLMDYSAWGVGIDAAVKWSPVSSFSLGLNLQDVFGTWMFWNSGVSESVSPTAKMGASFEWPLSRFSTVVTFAADCDFRFEGREYSAQYSISDTGVSFDTHTGIELLISNTVGLRLGSNEGNMTAGAGLKLGIAGHPVTLDYAWLSHDQLDNTHRISAGVGF
ncbi:hypothetical protein CSA37_11695 [Candidatus Fermentibacteria bacterium]|nr:MAG: hypothetical protein CSA37_11695 [Candidatus Fermentibacteria bacterium]